MAAATHTSGRATAEVIFLALLIFVVQAVALMVGLGMELFALSAPLAERPWTIVLSVFAHGSIPHLAANLLGLAVFGFIVERQSTRLRFHAFVLVTGAVAGIAEVLVGTLLGSSPFVVGISGAVFALMGYVLASNPVTDTIFAWLKVDPRIQIVLMIVVAGAITWITRGERVALIAHFTGFLLGLLGGRNHILRA